MSRSVLAACVLFAAALVGPASAAPYAPIVRTVPPPGIELPAATRERLAKEAAELRAALPAGEKSPLAPDVEALMKAVELALQFQEFYSEKDVAKADELLQLARQRLPLLASNSPAWKRQTGLVVRGYRSQIDGSAQPYGMVIPAGHDFSKPCPLYVFLHGRGEKSTDLHFLAERLHNAGPIAPPGALVLHPFGRQCVGWKAAGEVDVLDAVQHVKSQYAIDENRVVLMGFSMGGAGAWHVGAHFADQWCAVAPGAGFSETAQFMRWKPADYGPWYEQKLWGLYDVPGYTRNLFNLPVVAYSGEKDGQIQAARVMEAAFQAEGRTLQHILGPATEHKYHPESLAQVLAILNEAVVKGRNTKPAQVLFQTRSLRYPALHWVEALELDEHWLDSRINATLAEPHKVEVATKNVRVMRLTPWANTSAAATFIIDGQTLEKPADQAQPYLVKQDGKWQLTSSWPPAAQRVKGPGRQGPIDDAFVEPFLVVLPSGKCRHPQVQQWVDFELAHFRERWPAIMRGTLRCKHDVDVTPDDIKNYHLVLWGDANANSLLARLLPQWPLSWTAEEVRMGEKSFPAATHVPALIYLNQEGTGPQGKYVVLNSGPTFREAHDKNNSLQNPHLPDWAIIDTTTPPNDQWPGKVVDANFFDEQWRVKKN